MRGVAFAVGIGLALAGAAPSSADTMSWSKSGRPNTPIILSDSAVVGDSCKAIGTPNVRVVGRPKHGTTSVRHKVIQPNFPKGHPRAHCNGKPVKGISVIYQSKPGFKGRDQARILVGYPTGGTTNATVTINIK